MLQNAKRTQWCKLMALAICLPGAANALAKKPPKPPADDGAPPKYEVIELTGMRNPRDISNPLDGDVWVAGYDSEGSYLAAAYGHVNAAGEAVAGYLPEPRTPLPEGPWKDVYGDVFNRASNANSVNDHGDIVGGVDVFDADSDRYYVHRAAIWLNTESGYVLQETLGVLPTHNISSANGITNEGLIVGNSAFIDFSGVLPAEYRAFIWDPIGGMQDLNDLYPHDDWVLEWAIAISETDWVVGSGTLDGVERGFVLHLETGVIKTVPLPPNAGPWNRAYAVNTHGHVTGQAASSVQDEFGDYIPYAFYWDGQSEHAIDLGSLTEYFSCGSGINAAGQIVGYSYIDLGDGFPRSLATSWMPDGAMVSLATEVPSKPKWKFTYAGDVNDDGWIVAYGSRPYRNTYIQTAVVLTPVASE